MPCTILSVHKNKISLISNHLRHSKIFLKSNWLLELAINSTIHSVLILFMVHAYDVMNCRKIFRIKVPIMLLSHLSQRPIRKSWNIPHDWISKKCNLEFLIPYKLYQNQIFLILNADTITNTESPRCQFLQKILDFGYDFWINPWLISKNHKNLLPL